MVQDHVLFIFYTVDLWWFRVCVCVHAHSRPGAHLLILLYSIILLHNCILYSSHYSTYYTFTNNYILYGALQVDNADPPFPRSAGYWWFGCRSETKGSTTGNQDNTRSFFFPQLWFSEQRDEAKHKHDSDVDDLILDAGNISPPTI